jgi:azurin
LSVCSGAPETPPKTLAITANDKMKFDIAAFQVKPGQTIVVTLKSIGTQPNASIGHDFMLLKQNVNALSFVEANAAASNGEDMTIIPDSMPRSLTLSPRSSLAKLAGVSKTSIFFETETAPSALSRSFYCGN